MAAIRRVSTLVLRPSQDLGRLAAAFEPRLPSAFRWATRGLGTRDNESPRDRGMNTRDDDQPAGRDRPGDPERIGSAP